MFGSKMKLTSVLGTAFAVALSLGLADRAAAAPPPGMRWSDHAWGSSSRPPTDLKGYGLQQWMNSHRAPTPSRGQPPRVGPTYGPPRSYSYGPPAASAPALVPIPTGSCR